MTDGGTVLKVTGSSRGIGRAIALRLARDGYDIVVHCRSRIAEAEAVAADVRAAGRAARCLLFDVTEQGSSYLLRIQCNTLIVHRRMSILRTYD